MRLKIDWASLIVESKFTAFALFYFVFESNFPITSPGGLIFGGAILRRVFLRYRFGGLILGGAYAWRGLVSEFCGNSNRNLSSRRVCFLFSWNPVLVLKKIDKQTIPS